MWRSLGEDSPPGASLLFHIREKSVDFPDYLVVFVELFLLLNSRVQNCERQFSDYFTWIMRSPDCFCSRVTTISCQPENSQPVLATGNRVDLLGIFFTFDTLKSTRMSKFISLISVDNKNLLIGWCDSIMHACMKTGVGNRNWSILFPKIVEFNFLKLFLNIFPK